MHDINRGLDTSPGSKLEIIELSPWVCLSAIDSLLVNDTDVCASVQACYGGLDVTEGGVLWSVEVRQGLGATRFKHLEMTCECCMQVLGAAFKMNSCDWTWTKSSLSNLLQSTKGRERF